MAILEIELPDKLVWQAKARAELESITLSELIQGWLEEFAIEDDEEQEQAEDIRVVQAIQARIIRGEEKIYTWPEVDAQLAALDELPSKVC